VLKDSAALDKGESILIQGAAGGVGILSVQLAKIYGAKLVIAAASSPEKRELALSMGADLAVDYTRPNWYQQVLDATDGGGVHVVQAMAGGNIFKESFGCLAKFGRMIVYGFASREPGALNPERLLPFNHTIRGFFLGDYFSRKSDLVTATLAECAGYVSDGRLRIRMGGAFPLSGAGDAHRLLEGRQTQGKLVILPWQND
jgi:NADPH2:quinone reductase